MLRLGISTDDLKATPSHQSNVFREIINPPEYCSNPKNQGKDTTLIEPNLSRCRPFTPGLNKKVNFNVKKRSKNIKFKLKS
jgi:hypothetical protein